MGKEAFHSAITEDPDQTAHAQSGLDLQWSPI